MGCRFRHEGHRDRPSKRRMGLVTDLPVFERFQFHPAYTAEVDPEFPGTGDWGVPAYGFGRDGQVSETLESRWGRLSSFE